MRVDTVSGLHGQLIEFRATPQGGVIEPNGTYGRAIVLRDDYPFADAPYSVHFLYSDPDGNLYAEAGHYDMTLSDARALLDELTGRRTAVL